MAVGRLCGAENTQLWKRLSITGSQRKAVEREKGDLTYKGVVFIT